MRLNKIIVTLLSLFITIPLTMTQAQVPVMVKDINPGAESSAPGKPVAAWQNTFFFGADDGVNGYELWKSDGTGNGTAMIKDINPDTNSSCIISMNNITYFCAPNCTKFQYVNNTMYFLANNGLFLDTTFYGWTDSILYIKERSTLWKTDGTESGTVMIKDVIPASDMVSLGGETYFLATDGLWKTDGTESGTYIVKDFIVPASSEIIVYKNLLFFAGSVAGSNFELWTSDGTGTGTELFKEINIFNNSYGSSPRNFMIAGDLLYFTADNMVYDNTPLPNREVWVTDGTEAGTVMVKDIFPGVGSSSPTLYGSMGGYLYFTAYDSIYYPGWNYNRELWKSDGTESGTEMVRDINYHKPEPLPWGTGGNSSPSDVIFMNNMVFVVATDDANNNGSFPPLFTSRDIWKSDGTDMGTMKLKNIDTTNALAWEGKPRELIAAGSKFYFKAGYGNYGVELFESNGTESGTVMVADIYPGSESGEPQNMAYIDGYLYFTIDNGTEGRELWRIESPTGINEPLVHSETTFSVYPNPNSGRFTISFDNLISKPTRLRVSNILGKVVYTETIDHPQSMSKKQIDLHQLGAGVYFVTLETEGKSYVNKIIIL